MKLRLSSFLFPGMFLIFLCTSCKTDKIIPGEGFVEVAGGEVWYRIYGEGDKTPLLVLHGGPGSSSYGLEPLKALGKDRPVIFYDQLGSGRSSRIKDTSLMTIERYVEELEQVREALDLEDFYMYGQSWGPALGLEYYLTYPDEVKALIFSSPLFSTELWIRDADTLIATLPDSVQSVIRENERNQTFDSEAYKDAVDLFYSKFLRRKERTEAQRDTAGMYFGTNVYEYMWGPSEFTATGTLRNYDRVDRLDEIKVPTLLLTGEYDEARPETVRFFQSQIPNSEFVEIENSGHATLNDNPEAALVAIDRFLQKVDDETGE